MKLFNCQVCGQALYFENDRCLGCASRVAFLPDGLAMAAIEPAREGGEEWQVRPGTGHRGGPPRYRLCRNAQEHGICNFCVPVHDPNTYCVACRLTRVLPDLSREGNLQRWYAIEVAKRRLFYTLARLGLIAVDPPPGHVEKLSFEFLQDQPGQAVMTGHADGLITLNVAEADDDERARRRVQLHEPYRTLLGHLRHESGHYYWDLLIRDGGRTEGFRAVFGDESADYGEALRRHYETGGCPPSWQAAHVSAYATSHPWEDWAETWAHYLHMVDLVETAGAHQTRVALPAGGGPHDTPEVIDPFEATGVEFDDLVRRWAPLTLLVNSLNRSLGQPDAYPFALSPGALRKLRYVHDVIEAVRLAGHVPHAAA
ncbi:putative zinc-binding peptidase [Ramlibacter sp. AW1]|uniref:Zinc-binding peptidase n=1 Tax=Ramlibacter aurantiacus TaxID=2801330 RepID=A0A936ZDL4_9BURK|nr:putative zinc-binding peptidase [Ramlibacter aurantiacus]